MSRVSYRQAVVSGTWGRATFILGLPLGLATPDAAHRQMQAAKARVAGNSGQRLRRGAMAAYAPWPALAAAFSQITTTRGERVTAGVVNTHPIFPFKEFDTRAHVIRARNAPYLWFRGRSGWARVREVHHPGTHGLHALAGLLAVEQARFQAELRQAVREVWTDG